MRFGGFDSWLKLLDSWNRMAQQEQFWDETKSTHLRILEIVRSHYQEEKLFNEHLKNYSQQETGNNEEGNESVSDDVCQSKEELEEINGENLRETTSVLDPRGVLREDKGRKEAKLILKSLEDLLKIDQVHKDLVEINQMHRGHENGRMLRETETKSEKREIRVGIT